MFKRPRAEQGLEHKAKPKFRYTLANTTQCSQHRNVSFTYHAMTKSNAQLSACDIRYDSYLALLIKT